MKIKRIKLEKVQIAKLNNTQLRVVKGGDGHVLRPKSKTTHQDN